MASINAVKYCEYLLNTRIFQKTFLQNVLRRNTSSTSRVSTTVSPPNPQSDKETIVIPKRIKRGPTDILKALASTVGKDYTAPQYKYHDDPFFIPASNVSKRTYALAKESGRKAAKFFLEKYPDSFEYNPAEPNVEAFNPKVKYTADSEVTEEILMDCINAADVTNATVVYSNLRNKDVKISSKTQQALLELLCFYNCQQPLEDDLIEERWFRQTSIRETRKTWKDSGLAEEVFESMEVKDSKAYSTLIQGMAKYYQVDRAHDLYQKMQENQIPATVEVYNSLICITPFLKESSEIRWQFAEQLLHKMNEEGLQPTVTTMNCLLELITKFGAWPTSRQHALKVMAEMKSLNIEPSLASYYYLLVIFCRERGPESPILHDIMNYIENREFEIQDPKDIFFFVSAMDVCHNHLLDKNLAYRVHALLNYRNNYNLIGDSFKESIYYQHFFKLLCATENIHTFFDIYNKYVPNTYTPEPSVMAEILQAIDLNGALKYIPQIWSDIILFNHTEREKVVKMMLTIISKKQEPVLQERFIVIAKDIQQRLDSAPSEKRPRNIIQWTGQMLGDLMLVYLNGDKFEEAWTVMQKLDSEQHKILGYPDQPYLMAFCKACLEKKEFDKAMVCTRYSAEIGFTAVGEHIRLSAEEFQLPENYKAQLSEILDPKAVVNDANE